MFNIANGTKTGLASSCKQCKANARERDKEHIAAQKRTWYENNVEYVREQGFVHREKHKDRLKEYDAKKYLKNREAVLKYIANYQKENPEVGRKAGKKYRAANPDKQCAKAAKRRARLLRATPEWTLEDEWEQFYLAEIYHLSALRTEMLGESYNVDHMVPLTSKLVCGLHVSSNLQVLLGTKNSAKMNRHWPDMW